MCSNETIHKRESGGTLPACSVTQGSQPPQRYSETLFCENCTWLTRARGHGWLLNNPCCSVLGSRNTKSPETRPNRPDVIGLSWCHRLCDKPSHKQKHHTGSVTGRCINLGPALPPQALPIVKDTDGLGTTLGTPFLERHAR